MTIDEKIMEITNLIEHMLKKENHYMKVDYPAIAFDYINDEIVKKYKNQTQCFRHASKKSINERQSYDEAQKEFFVDMGITILKVIYSLIKNGHILVD